MSVTVYEHAHLVETVEDVLVSVRKHWTKKVTDPKVSYAAQMLYVDVLGRTKNATHRVELAVVASELASQAKTYEDQGKDVLAMYATRITRQIIKRFKLNHL